MTIRRMLIGVVVVSVLAVVGTAFLTHGTPAELAQWQVEAVAERGKELERQAIWAVENSRYVYDERTELCFLAAYRHGSSSSGGALAQVDCDKVRDHLINPPAEKAKGASLLRKGDDITGATVQRFRSADTRLVYRLMGDTIGDLM